MEDEYLEPKIKKCQYHLCNSIMYNYQDNFKNRFCGVYCRQEAKWWSKREEIKAIEIKNANTPRNYPHNKYKNTILVIE